jgi:hypothetical protein
MQQFVGKLAENPYVGRDADGHPALEDNVLSVLERITGSAYARGQVTQSTGLEITDNDDDGIPDSKEQVKATYDYVVQNGVPLDESTLVYDVGQVRDVLFHDPSGAEENVTVLVVGIPGTREQTVVKAAREALTEDLEVLRQNPLITLVGVTGSPFVREGQLGATTSSLQTSLPHSGGSCLGTASADDALSPLRGGDHYPHRPGSGLALRPDVPARVQLELRNGHHRCHIHWRWD